MADRLTDKQKKIIIADYVEIGSYNAVAKKHGVSLNTVKNIVLQNADIAQKCNQKKEQNTLEMLAYMDAHKAKAQAALDKFLDALLDDEKIKAASVTQLATSFGIIADKFMKAAQANPEATLPDDGLIDALNDITADLWDDGDDSKILKIENMEFHDVEHC